MNKCKILFIYAIFCTYSYLIMPSVSLASTGGFIIRTSQQKNIKISNKKLHPNLTPSKMRRLYSSNLYKSFHDVLKLKGFHEYYIPRLFCIAKMESSFNSVAINLNKNGTVDKGLFQINSVWKNICKTHGTMNNVEFNIDCAKKITERSGLKPWVTYKRYGYICEQSLEI